MALQRHPELADVREYNTPGVDIDVATDAPTSAGGKASYVCIGATKLFLSTLVLELANGQTRTYEVWPSWDLWVEYVAIKAGTTADAVQVGWV